MRTHPVNRLLSFMLALVMVLGLVPVSGAATGLSWRETELTVQPDRSHRQVSAQEQADDHEPTDIVRVSIVLEDAPTAGAGFATMGIARDQQAVAYDRILSRRQKAMEQTISTQALGGKKLDVVWNLTLVTNLISANVPYGSLDAIRAVPGVREVRLERQYSPETVEPQTHSSGEMTGAAALWQSGYTGAGSRIAIVDTGTDTDHQSFDNGAFLHALEQNAADLGLSEEQYLSRIDLLDTGDVDRVLELLNVTERIGYDDASAYYINEKLPFAANYVDRNLVVDHDHDAQGSHGSHVAGIAAANRFIPVDGGYADARQEVFMAGAAPDAQIITMKVFGTAEGPFDSDYFAAVEDAIWLGCDSVNLSLGSGSPGSSYSESFADLLEFLETTDTVVVMSAGNSGQWAEQTVNGMLYADGVSFHTAGEPGTYTNALSVASVDNDGAVGNYFTVDGRTVVYTESTGFRNRAFTTLDTTARGTEQDFVLVDSIGKTEDYTGIDINGKVVLCLRGETSFAEKANAAARLGAKAIIICNDRSGVMGMDLTDYRYSAPCVSISKADAAAIRAAGQEHTSPGGIKWYSGTMTVYRGEEAAHYQSEYYTLSAFSSWGVPGSLELKPEITAPGGNIWSVNGVDTSGEAYEYMSGTSMAAPQVAGMAAQLAQYIREQGLAEKTGLSVRQLTQSLLMSTAVPLREETAGGSYYPVLAQGAGFARVDLAASAESYVLVEGQSDGKVKAQLGEDARRRGEYTFAFTLNNLTDAPMVYALRADLFTQGILDDGENRYLDSATRALTAEAVYTCDGKMLTAVDGFVCDLNGDNATNAADADHLLEYLLGNVQQLHADGDVDGNGAVTSYDAHLLLAHLGGGHVVGLEPGGSARVKVKLTLTDETRAMLEEEYPTGAYLEGFVYAEPQADSEGVAGVTHSIPLLGWYGSWTEPGMFDVGSYAAYTAGVQERDAYLYDIVGIENNFVSISYGDDEEYLFGGNPYVQEDEYLPRRNAFNNRSGYRLQNLRFALIRNAFDTRLILENVDEELWLISEEFGAVGGAYYHVNAGSWMETQQRLPLGLDLAGIPENTTLELRLEAVPELYRYYESVAGVYDADWTKLKEGGVLATPFTIDNTAPQVLDIRQEGDTLRVTARDNQYIAAVALMNAAGTGTLEIIPGNQLTPDTVLDAALDLSALYGTEFLVAVYDYAENVTVCQVQVELTRERPRFTAVDQETGDYLGLREDGTQVRLTNGGSESIRAAEYVDGYVFRVDDRNRLWITSDRDLYDTRFLSELDPEGLHEIVSFNDLAYSTQDQTLYGSFYSERNAQETPYLCTIDLYTGEMTVLGDLSVDAHCMTIDDSGNFYAVGYGVSRLYTFRADNVTTGKYSQVGSLSDYAATGYAPLAWDHEEDVLFWAHTNSSGTRLLQVDHQTAAVKMVAEYPFRAAGLYIAGTAVGDTFAPADYVSAVKLPDSAHTIAGGQVQLTAQVLPWNVSDDGVNWSSSDTAVATVDENGVVTGISGGTAVITAASRLDGSKKAACTVTVEELSTEFKALVWDEAGEVWFSSFQPGKLSQYGKLAAADVPLTTTAYHNGVLYAGTIDTGTGLSELYTVDPGTFALTKVGGSDAIAYMDLCYAPKLGYLVATYFNYITLVDPTTGEYVGAFDWSEGVAGDLVGVTHVGSEYSEEYGAWIDVFLLLDNRGDVYTEAIMPYNGSFATFNGPADGLLGNMGGRVDYSYFQGFHFDGSHLYWSRFNEADNCVELRMMDVLGSGAVYRLGYFPESVWPVGGLYTDAQVTASALSTGFAAQTIRQQSVADAAELVTDRGSLNAVQPASTAGVDMFGMSYVNVTYDRETTNGILRVEYDADKVVFAGLEPGCDACAIRELPGAVEIAFAHGSGISAGALVASLGFWNQRGVWGGEAAVTIRTRELGQEQTELVETLTMALHLPATPFEDVEEGSFYHIPVLWALENGITNGMSDTEFGSTAACNRAQVVTFLWRAAGKPEPSSSVNPFVDVQKGSFYEKAVLWAVEKGITNGTDSTHFSPNDPCNRAAVVTFLWRAAGKPAPTTSKIPFRDVPAGSWYADPVLWAVENGITNGMSATEFGATATCNRAQVVTFLYRAFA